MINYISTSAIRNDAAGSGHFGAPRGDRKHRGIDYAVPVGAVILAPVAGTVTKLGYCYADDLQWRYVEVTDGDGSRHRAFYVDPCVETGMEVTEYDPIGVAQDITRRYPGSGMIAHVHYEVIAPNGDYVEFI